MRSAAPLRALALLDLPDLSVALIMLPGYHPHQVRWLWSISQISEELRPQGARQISW